jgi:hypothetical protein
MSALRRILLWLVGSATVTVVSGVLAGCSAGGSTQAPAPVPVPTPTSFAQLQLPINAYALTDTQSADAQYIGQRMIHVCMARFGFNYPSPGETGPGAAQLAEALQIGGSRLWGVSDPVAAREYGYTLPSTGPVTPPPNKKNLLPSAELAVLNGPTSASSQDGQQIPVGGCIGQTQREQAAAGISYQGSALVAEIAAKSFVKTLSDPRTLAVFAKWSACMRSSGYNYSTPLKAVADPRWNLNAPPTQAEIQTAETDVACKFKTNLLGVTFAVQSDYENGLIEQNAQALAQVKAAVDAEARKLPQLVIKYGV